MFRGFFFFSSFGREVEIGGGGKKQGRIRTWRREGVISFFFCSSWVEEKLSLAATLLGQ